MQIISIILIFIISLFSNPTWSNPACEYIQSNSLEHWDAICENTIDNENFMSRIEWRFSAAPTLDECLYVEVLPYNTDIIWHFSKPFIENDEVCVVLVDQNYTITNVIFGKPLPDGNVLFDFSEVEGGTYYLFEFSNIIT